MIGAIILAGGRSTRLGTDKRQLRLWGEAGPTLLEATAALVAQRCHDACVVLPDPANWSQLPLRLIADPVPQTGPLGGFAAGLAATSMPRVLLLACDAPLLSGALLEWLMAQPDAADVVALADHSDRAQPLLAIYRRECLATVERLLAAGERRMQALLAALTVTALPPERWHAVDPHGHALLNVNRPEDLAQVRQILAALPL